MSMLYRITGVCYVSIEYSSEIFIRVPNGTTQRELANIDANLLNQLLEDNWEAEESEECFAVDSIDVQMIEDDVEEEEEEEDFELEKDQDGNWIRKH